MAYITLIRAISQSKVTRVTDAQNAAGYKEMATAEAQFLGTLQAGSPWNRAICELCSYISGYACGRASRKPKAVPPLILKTAAERRRWREAGERRKVRLALRYGQK